MGADGVYRGDNAWVPRVNSRARKCPMANALRFAREDEAIAPAAGAGESAGWRRVAPTGVDIEVLKSDLRKAL